MEIFRMTEFYLRLKASVEANKFRYGYPWIYSNEIISDRRTKSLLPGSFCTLIDYNKNPICLVTVNPNSKIFARVMDYNLETKINAYWLKDKISKYDFAKKLCNILKLNSLNLKKSKVSNITLYAKRNRNQVLDCNLYQKTFKRKLPSVALTIKDLSNNY